MDKKDFAQRLVALRQNKGVSARDMSLSLGQSAGYTIAAAYLTPGTSDIRIQATVEAFSPGV